MNIRCSGPVLSHSSTEQFSDIIVLSILFIITCQITVQSTIIIKRYLRGRVYENVDWSVRSHGGHIPKTCGSTSHCAQEINWYLAKKEQGIFIPEMNISTLIWPKGFLQFRKCYSSLKTHCNIVIVAILLLIKVLQKVKFQSSSN